MRRHALILFALCLFSPVVLTSVQPASAQKAAANTDEITADQLRAYLTFIASDELEGRDTPSRGLDTAAKFIATQLTRWGVKPAGDSGTYYQRIVLSRGKTDVEGSKAEINGKALTYGEDYFAPPTPGTASAALVYGGSGWYVKSKNLDAYQDTDPKGKIVLLDPNSRFAPPGIRRNEMTGEAGKDYADPITYARQKGAVGIVYIAPKSSPESWKSLRSRIENGSPNYSVERFQSGGGVSLPSLYLSEKTLTTLLAGEKTDAETLYKSLADRKPLPAFALSPDKKLTLTVAAKIDKVTTQNVVGMLEGSDPVLKNEFVAVSAHYDHVGTTGASGRGAVAGHTIFNGADDDGSGTVSVLAIAEALAKSPSRPKRSILFIWHCGEEKGLWGSQYYTQFPTVPLEKIVTDLNIDMIGRSKKPGDTKPVNRLLTAPDEIYVVGATKMSTDLDKISRTVNQNYLNLKFNYHYDEPNEPEGIFFRSDHYNYARKGIPIIFYFDGVHEDYHRVTDTVEKIDFTKMQNVARTIYQMLWAVGDLSKRPAVDKGIPQ